MVLNGSQISGNLKILIVNNLDQGLNRSVVTAFLFDTSSIIFPFKSQL